MFYQQVEPSRGDGKHPKQAAAVSADHDEAETSADDEGVAATEDDDQIIGTFTSQLEHHRKTFKRRCRTLIAKTLCQYDELTQQVYQVLYDHPMPSKFYMRYDLDY